MHAGIAQALVDGHHLRRALDAGCLALVLGLGLFLERGQKFVTDITTRNGTFLHQLGCTARQQEHVADDGRVEPAFVAIADELLHLAGIVAQLRDEELRACDDLLFHLQVLRDGLALEVLKGVDHAAVVKVRGFLDDVALAAGNDQTRIHLGSEHLHVHRVEVEHWARAAGPTSCLVVAGHEQDVLETLALHAVQLRNDLVARAILAREVHERNDALVEKFLAKRIGEQRGIATRIVGDGHGMYATSLVHALGFLELTLLAVFASASPGNDFARDDELALLERVLESIAHQTTS